MAAAVAVATVYGRYHYAVDSLAGIAIGATLGGASLPLYRFIGGRKTVEVIR
jgi:membrane-associated phospholipid phosphatase